MRWKRHMRRQLSTGAKLEVILILFQMLNLALIIIHSHWTFLMGSFDILKVGLVLRVYLDLHMINSQMYLILQFRLTSIYWDFCWSVILFVEPSRKSKWSIQSNTDCILNDYTDVAFVMLINACSSLSQPICLLFMSKSWLFSELSWMLIICDFCEIFF